ncbi:MAG: hypothetical protein IJV35_00820 [Neisseriaceae bacterium]|nr:hypothetical protein [Neisseriaceae bacterium]
MVGWISNPPSKPQGLHNNVINACRHCGGLKQRQAAAKTHPTADGKSKKFSGCLKDILYCRSPN